jgi:hypothetical protein
MSYRLCTDPSCAASQGGSIGGANTCRAAIRLSAAGWVVKNPALPLEPAADHHRVPEIRGRTGSIAGPRGELDADAIVRGLGHATSGRPSASFGEQSGLAGPAPPVR